MKGIDHVCPVKKRGRGGGTSVSLLFPSFRCLSANYPSILLMSECVLTRILASNVLIRVLPP